jgi:hypothetical protein
MHVRVYVGHVKACYRRADGEVEIDPPVLGRYQGRHVGIRVVVALFRSTGLAW